MESALPVVHVSTGMGLGGGGIGVVGRLLATAAAEFARSTGAPFRALNLGPADDVPDLGFPVESFEGSHVRLAAAVAGVQARGSALLLFDHVGPARVQALIPAPLRSRFAVYIHGIEVWRTLRGTRKRAIARASRLLANSEYTVNRARSFGFPKRAVRIAPPALEERRPAGVPDLAVLQAAGESYFLIAGRMSSKERYKGHDEVLEAFAAVHAASSGARLVVAGSGDDRERLRQKAESLGIGDAVLFTGFVSEATLGLLYARAIAFVMPSRDEGFGIVFLEAMRAGIPSVALRGTAPAELIQDGETGVLVAPGDRAALSEALVSLVSNSGRARAMGERARGVVERRYSPASFRATVLQEIEALARGDGHVRD